MNHKLESIITNKIDDSIKNGVIFHNGEVYTYFDCGLTRYVFVNKDKTKVIKLLINPDQHNYNTDEIEIYESANEDTKTRFAKTSIAMGGVVIEQEFCNPIKYDDRTLNLSQILFAKSCRNEVGWTKDGKLVCFDLDEYKKW